MQLWLIPAQIKIKDMKKVFVGIDFSKSKFDASLVIDGCASEVAHQEFVNEPSGYQEFIKWVKKQTSQPQSSWLVCGEHTGLYSYSLSVYLQFHQIAIWLESGLQIKRSMGVVRGKNDKLDSTNIALYCYRNEDKVSLYAPRQAVIDQIKDLQAYRSRLIKIKDILWVPIKELARIKDNKSIDFISEHSFSDIKQIEGSIKDVELQIKKLIHEDESVSENYKLLTSIKGVGPQTAQFVLIFTGNFSLFDDPRKFGCYSGVVPFEHESGSSIKKKDRISNLANKKMKEILTLAARSAINHDLKMKNYYQRKIKEGKSDRVVVNNVRNKLIHIMFAVVRNKIPYNSLYEHPMKQIA